MDRQIVAPIQVFEKIMFDSDRVSWPQNMRDQMRKMHQSGTNFVTHCELRRNRSKTWSCAIFRPRPIHIPSQRCIIRIRLKCPEMGSNVKWNIDQNSNQEYYWNKFHPLLTHFLTTCLTKKWFVSETSFSFVEVKEKETEWVSGISGAIYPSQQPIWWPLTWTINQPTIN